MPKTFKEMRDIAEFFYRPDEKRYGIAIYTDNSYDGLARGFESVLFSYGGELGDYATYKVDGIINSDKAIAALDAYKELYKFTPPGWAKRHFRRGQPGDHREPGRDEHELLRVLPVADQRGEQPERQEHRLLRQPGRPRLATSSPRSAVRASRSSPTRRSRTRPSSSWSGSSRTRPRRSGQTSAATPAALRC